MNRDVHVQFQMLPKGKLFTPGVTVIIVLSVLGFVLSLFAPDFTLKWLALSAGGLFHGIVWQLVTYPFINPSPLWLVCNMAVVLVIGSAIERQWYTKAFVVFWFFVTGLCGLAWAVITMAMAQVPAAGGSAAMGYAMVAVFGLIFRDKRFLLMTTTVNGKTLSLIMLGISVIINLYPSPINLVWMLGAVLGYAFVKLRERSQYTQSRPSHRNVTYEPSSFIDID